MVSASQSFPADALPYPLGDFVNDQAKTMDCDPSMLALPLLTALASAIGNTTIVVLKRGWIERSILWTAVVGKSGSMKTPSQKAVLRPIRLREQAAIEAHRRALAAYGDELARFEALPKKDRGRAPLPPTCVRLTVSDITTEALALRLAENPRGLLVVHDELAGLFGAFNQYKPKGSGSDVAHWLAMHSGDALMMDRRGGGGSLIAVPVASVSITGGIQPDALRQCLLGAFMHNGMAARWLLSMPPWKPKRWTDAEPDAGIEDAVAGVFNRLYSLPLRVDAHGTPAPVAIGFSRPAKRLLIPFLDEHNAMQEQLEDEESAAWSKLEAYCARLALVLHMAGWAGSGSSGEPGAIQPAMVEAAIHLTRWFSQEARRVYAMLKETDEGRELRRVIERIHRMGGRVSVRDWQRARHHPTAGEAEDELEGLVKDRLGGWAYPAPGRSGGQPVRLFVLSSAESPRDTCGSDATPAGEAESGVVSPVTLSQGASSAIADDAVEVVEI